MPDTPQTTQDSPGWPLITAVINHPTADTAEADHHGPAVAQPAGGPGVCRGRGRWTAAVHRWGHTVTPAAGSTGPTLRAGWSGPGGAVASRPIATPSYATNTTPASRGRMSSNHHRKGWPPRWGPASIPHRAAILQPLTSDHPRRGPWLGHGAASPRQQDDCKPAQTTGASDHRQW